MLKVEQSTNTGIRCKKILQLLVHSYVLIIRPWQQYKGTLPRCVRELVLRKRRMWRWWRVNPTRGNKVQFNAASRLCSRVVYKYHEQQEKSLLVGGTLKLYRFVSNRLHPESGDNTLRRKTNYSILQRMYQTVLQKNSLQNFCSTPTNQRHTDYNDSINNSHLKFVNVTVHEVDKLLSS